ncbi:MAG TPA: flagellin [Sphingobium sp.]|uniref:flagellin n=1 Tax=Sphingobium sp. TaxID=1912891 RepID=UPI002ECFBABA
MVFITSQSVNAEIKRQQTLATDIANYQQQISTGNKLSKPSDNPQDWIQISVIGRQQSLTDAWTSNLNYGQARAAQASSSLSDINNLMASVSESLITATSQGAGSPGAEAIAQTLQNVRDSISTIMNQTDYQGTPTFDNGVSNKIPIGQGLAYEAVGTRQSLETVTTDSTTTPPTTKSIYDILDAAIAAVKAGDSAGISKAMTDAKSALDHVIVEQSQQGVRGKRLDDETTRLQTQNLNLTERLSPLADTDLTEAVTKVQSKLVTLQAAQAVFAKINQQSLFDLLK